MKPKFRAYGRKGYRMSTEIEPKEMYYDVSVVTTFDKKELHVIVDFGMWNEEEYNGTELIDYDLMQSTGLKDKNGTEVFEGDIVEYSLPLGYSGKGEVIFDEEYGWFNIDGFYAGIYDYPTLAFSEGTDNFEVIGNIHEHPHLLED